MNTSATRTKSAFKLSEAVQVKARFGRSVNLERDFYQDVPLDGYVLTSTARVALERISEAMVGEFASKAWTFTGTYGSGKSTFALYLAKLLNLQSDASREHARELLFEKAPDLWSVLFGKRPSLIEKEYSNFSFFPILITGSREPLGLALLRGINNAISRSTEVFDPLFLEKCTKLLAEASVDGNEIVGIIREINATLKGKARILLVIDELGKLLEYVAIYPEKSDVGILQQLAELARDKEFGFFLITILHQAFEHYAENLGKKQRDELSKVQGRFEDLIFSESEDQVLHILRSAFSVSKNKRIQNGLTAIGNKLASEAVGLGLAPRLSENEARLLLKDCLPLHPLVALSLGPVFNKFGQNERSLFAFVSGSDNHYSLPRFLERTLWTEELHPVITVDALYDYLTSAFGSGLYTGTNGRKWVEIEEAIDRIGDPSDLEIRLIKTIGLLKLIGDRGNFKSSPEVLRFALVDDSVSRGEVDAAIASLEKQSIILRRRFSDTYVIWEGSDVDLEAEFRSARSLIDPTVSLAKRLSASALLEPFVAKRHSFETGNLRFFERVFADAEDFLDVCNAPLQGADGRIVYLLISNRDDLKKHEEDISSATVKLKPWVVVSIPKDLTNLRDAVESAAAWKWVSNNTPELESDRVARKELAGKTWRAEQNIFSWLNALSDHRASSSTKWYCRSQQLSFSGTRELQSKLSDILDDVYHSAPKIKNELINRNKISSAAAAARKRLFHRMLESGNEERLGIRGNPAELSMYFSVLEETTLHKVRSGKWGFQKPDEDSPTNLHATWQYIEQFLEDSESSPKPVTQLFDDLSRPPYGMKAGLLPILLTSALLHFETELALYEKGSFIPRLGIPHFERLCKSPADFTLQFCRIEGLRRDVLETLAGRLLPSEFVKDAEKLDVLSLVRPLAKFASQLDEYTLRTGTLSQKTTRVRTALLAAAKPDELIFEKLPTALGFEEFGREAEYSSQMVRDFSEALAAALGEMKRAYGSLLENAEIMLAEAFGSTKRNEELREELIQRSLHVYDYVVQPKVKSLILRFRKIEIPFSEWLESVMSQLVGKPVQNWTDDDLSSYQVSLREVARSFKGIEAVAVELPSENGLSSSSLELFRVSVTKRSFDEINEKQQTVVLSQEEKEKILELKSQISEKFSEALGSSSNDRQIAILAHLAWELINDEENA